MKSSEGPEAQGKPPTSVVPQDVGLLFADSEGPETPEEMERQLRFLESRGKQVQPSVVN